ncbi:MAG TPA: cytochrome c oxidase subunit 3 [Stellaceae bacterium]|nr:cytochrome c oxidase subunit 3 [Stellaceae bacterium]
MSDAVFPYRPPLPMGSLGRRASGYWGAVFLVLSEASIFAYLCFSYFYFSVQPHSGPWPPGGPPGFTYTVPQTAAIILAAAAMWWADRAADRAEGGALLLGQAAGLALGIGFVALQFLDWYDKPFALATDPYASLYYVLTGVHLAHVVLGLIMAMATLLWTGLGYFGRARHVPVTVAALYWCFLAAVWLVVFFTLNITPYLT